MDLRRQNRRVFCTEIASKKFENIEHLNREAAQKDNNKKRKDEGLSVVQKTIQKHLLIS